MIRRAEERDIPKMLEMLLQNNILHHNGRPDLFKGPTTKYNQAQLVEMFKNEKKPVFVYEDENGLVCGYAFCAFICYENDNLLTDIKTLYIDDICVDEALRGRHIGNSLYEYVLAFAKEAGCYNVTLNVWSLNPTAQRFYEKMGLKPYKIGMEAIL